MWLNSVRKWGSSLCSGSLVTSHKLRWGQECGSTRLLSHYVLVTTTDLQHPRLCTRCTRQNQDSDSDSWTRSDSRLKSWRLHVSCCTSFRLKSFIMNWQHVFSSLCLIVASTFTCSTSRLHKLELREPLQLHGGKRLTGSMDDAEASAQAGCFWLMLLVSELQPSVWFLLRLFLLWV